MRKPTAAVRRRQPVAGTRLVRGTAQGAGTRRVVGMVQGAGLACRDAKCANLCHLAQSTLSNVGCEYWGVDLDNAMIDAGTSR